jgi:hypothetical protein
LAEADLRGATYAPASPPPDPYVARIRGLWTVTFPKGEEVGLVQLRELIQKAGLRDLEREATYAIEHGRTRHAIADWKENPASAAEGVFRLVLFDLTTAYGLHPARALILVVVLWTLLIPVYAWPIRFPPRLIHRARGIYRIWPSDRIEVRRGKRTVDNPTRVERLRGGAWTALGWAAYFSLLSAFHIGWRDLNVGTWISRIQPREFALSARSWVRVVSGLQSLLSVYLIAIWVLTYFGRPFQ